MGWRKITQEQPSPGAALVNVMTAYLASRSSPGALAQAYPPSQAVPKIMSESAQPLQDDTPLKKGMVLCELIQSDEDPKVLPYSSYKDDPFIRAYTVDSIISLREGGYVIETDSLLELRVIGDGAKSHVVPTGYWVIPEDLGVSIGHTVMTPERKNLQTIVPNSPLHELLSSRHLSNCDFMCDTEYKNKALQNILSALDKGC